jgi:hypothetical protein
MVISSIYFSFCHNSINFKIFIKGCDSILICTSVVVIASISCCFNSVFTSAPKPFSSQSGSSACVVVVAAACSYPV